MDSVGGYCQVSQNGRREPNSTTRETVQVKKLFIPSRGQTRESIRVANKSSRSRFTFEPKFLSSNSSSTMAEITPTTVSLGKYKRGQRTDV